MNENNNEEILYQVKPRFNLVYEMFMPTGRKIKKSFLVTILMIIIEILLSLSTNYLDVLNVQILQNYTLLSILKLIVLLFSLVFAIKFIANVVIQKMQYNSISYTFFKDYMVYEDKFLNQRKKTIDYLNVKEIEIRRTVLDRILGFGIVIIFTSAENRKNNGMVIYGLKNPKEVYEKVSGVIKEAKNSNKKDIYVEKINDTKLDNSKKDEVINQENVSSVDINKDSSMFDIKTKEEVQKIEEEFKNSIKN